MANTVQSIQVAGGNLFQIAAQYLGNATQWNRIAELNGLTDPFLAGPVTLSMPPVSASAGNGGVLGE
jgi:hypothetical protein